MTIERQESGLGANNAAATEIKAVRVVDIEMSFGAMVIFMVKGVLAAIPALLILGILGMICAGFLGALVNSH